MDHYRMHVFWSDEDGGFIAEALDLPGCSAWGKTEDDATTEARHAIAAWLRAARVGKHAIPAPRVVKPMPHDQWPRPSPPARRHESAAAPSDIGVR